MRPLIAAEPMLRAPRPEMVSESTLTGVTGAEGGGVEDGADVCAAAVGTGAGAEVTGVAVAVDPLPGLANSELAIGTFASIFEYVTFCRFGLPLTPLSMENGRYQPL